MNLRNTAILFALFMTVLWVFGFMLATKQPLAEQGFLFPTLQEAQEVQADSLRFERNLEKGKQSFSLVRQDKAWQLVSGKLATAVEASRIKPLIERIKNAKNNPDAEIASDLAELGLDPPLHSITIKGRAVKKEGQPGEEQSWTLQLGKESADKMVVYATSSERPGQVFAVTRTEVDSLLFSEPVALHPQQFFTFPVEESLVRKITFSSAKNKVELVRTEEGLWKIVTPPLGYADPERTLPLGFPLKGPLEKEVAGGVKGLILAIRVLRVLDVEDFEPLGKADLSTYSLADKKETLRITVECWEDSDKKKMTTETLLVGANVGNKLNHVYVRQEGDPAVGKIKAENLRMIREILEDPQRLRSRDIAFFQKDQVTKVTLAQGSDRVDLSREGKNWQVKVGEGRTGAADDRAVEKLLEALRAAQIDRFEKEIEDPKEAKLSLEKPGLEVKIVETSHEEEKDAKDKDGKEKAEKKEGKQRETVLRFSAPHRGAVYVQRLLPDKNVTVFQVPADLLEKVTGKNLTLTYLDLSLPAISPEGVTEITLVRDGSPIVLRRHPTGPEKWQIKDPREASGFAPAEQIKVQGLLMGLAKKEVKAQKWLEKIGPKTDLKAMGLDNPAVTLSVKHTFSPSVLGVGISLGSTPLPLSGLNVWGGMILQNEEGPPAMTLRLGQDNGKEEERGIYATHSATDLVFLVPPDLLKAFKEMEFRDRQGMLSLQPALDLGLLLQASADARHLFALASPLVTGKLITFDPAQVKELKIAQRTPEELRQFTFTKKEKVWQDLSSLKEFNLDPAKVDRFLKEVSEVEALRIMSITGPLAEQKLSDKDAALRVEMIFEDGSTASLSIGAPFDLEKTQGQFAQVSVEPKLVYLLPRTQVEPWLRGLAIFARDRVARAP